MNIVLYFLKINYNIINIIILYNNFLQHYLNKMEKYKFLHNIKKNYNFLLLILILLFSNVHLLFYRIQPLTNGKYLWVSSTNIYIFTNNFKFDSEEIVFNDDQKLDEKNSEQKELISFAQFFDEPNYNIIAVKQFLYFFDNEGKKLCQFEESQFSGFNLTLVDYKCSVESNKLKCQYFTSFINSDKIIEVFWFKSTLNSTDCQNNLLYSTKYTPINSLESSTISACNTLTCQVMNYNNVDVLTCFYENETPNELVAVNFNITNIQITSSHLLPAVFKSNNGCQQIDSSLSLSKTKTFVCYIDNNNECHCLFYDIQKNKWGTDQIFFEQCVGTRRSLFENKYIRDTKQYLLCCYPTLQTYKLQIFDTDFNQLTFNNTDSCDASISTLFNCSGIDSHNIVYMETRKSYQMLSSCSDSEEYKFLNVRQQCGLILNYTNNNDSWEVEEEFEEEFKEEEEFEENEEKEELEEKLEIEEMEEKLELEELEENEEKEELEEKLEIEELEENEEIEEYEEIDERIEKEEKEENEEKKEEIQKKFDELEKEVSDEIREEMKDENEEEKKELIEEQNELNDNEKKEFEELKEKSEEIKEEENSGNLDVIINITYKNNTLNKSIIEGTINMEKEDVVTKFDDIIKIMQLNKTYILTGEDYDVIISEINTYVKNQTNIEFKECEKILRRVYELSPDEILTIFKMEINKKNDQSLTWQLEYAVYNSLKERLNLSYCEDLDLKINYTIKNSSFLDIDTISQFTNMGVNVFNINDNFFNDICYMYENSTTDYILKDRRKEIYQNYSMCDNNCEYLQIDLDEMIFSCNCKVKTELSYEIETISFSDAVEATFKDSNIDVIKCYKLVFNFSNKGRNIGFWIMLIVVIIHIPCIVYYFFNNEKTISKYVFNEMKKNNYISTENNNPPLIKKKMKNKTNTIKKKETKSIKKENLRFSNKYNYSQTNGEKWSINKTKNSKENKSLKVDISTSNRKLISKKNAGMGNSFYINNINVIYNKKKKSKPTKSQKKLIINHKISNIKKLSHSSKEKKISENLYYTLIHIDANNYKKINIIITDYFLNVYTFKEAIKKDNRSFWRLLYISLLNNENVLNAFLLKSPLEIRALRICLTIFIYSCNLSLNTLFYTTNKISDKHHYTGDNLIIFTFVNNITISIFSTLTSFVLTTFFKILINSRYKIENVFREEENKIRKNKKYTINDKNKKQIKKKIENIICKLRVKNLIFICIELLLMLFFLYFVTAFCEVYTNTQSSWLIDCFSSFVFSFFIEFLESILIASLYLSAVTYKLECIFNIVLFIYRII